MTHHRPHFSLSLSAAAALLLCTLAGNSAAQSRSYDAPSNRVYNPSLYMTLGAISMNPDNAFGTTNHGNGWALRFGKPVSPTWDIQFGATAAQLDQGGTNIKQTTLGLDGLYLFSRERFRPFVLMGIGSQRDEVTTGSTNTATSPYLSAGLGVQWSLGDQWGMQIDARRSHAYLNGSNFAFNRANTDSLHIALTYAFGKVPEPSPVARAMPPEPTIYVEAPRPTPAPAPAPEPVVVVVMPPPAPAPVAPPRLERVTFADTELFGFDSYLLKMPQQKLDGISDIMQKYPDVQKVVITGYSDRLGSAAYNQTLSQRRADSVKNYLTGKGVAANRLHAAGKGQNNPVVDCTEKKRSDLIECLAPNRRVEVEQFVVERRVP
jgi:OmpA-OmpF porin, OOP family